MRKTHWIKLMQQASISWKLAVGKTQLQSKQADLQLLHDQRALQQSSNVRQCQTRLIAVDNAY